MNYRHLGIVLTVIGTASLAFSVKVQRQYTGEMARIADKLKESDDTIEPTETSISRGLFWTGLTLIAAGSLLQW